MLKLMYLKFRDGNDNKHDSDIDRLAITLQTLCSNKKSSFYEKQFRKLHIKGSVKKK